MRIKFRHRITGREPQAASFAKVALPTAVESPEPKIPWQATENKTQPTCVPDQQAGKWTERIREQALLSGFSRVGFTADLLPTRSDYVREWVRAGCHGAMSWFSRGLKHRLSPSGRHFDIKSAIVGVFVCGDKGAEDVEHRARFTQGLAYETWVTEKLEALADFIKTDIDCDFRCRVFAGNGPVLERDLATKAGLGWIGKNTCLVNRDLGSHVFIGVILGNLELVDDRFVPDHCGSCMRCVEACPTKALKPYQLNASRCLSYQNMELKGERDRALWPFFGNRLVGCDACQEVCPWNKKAETAGNELLHVVEKQDWLRAYLDFEASDFQKQFAGTAVMRVRWLDFMRNLFLVIAGERRVDLLPAVLEWRERHGELDLAECGYCIKVLGQSSLRQNRQWS